MGSLTKKQYKPNKKNKKIMKKKRLLLTIFLWGIIATGYCQHISVVRNISCHDGNNGELQAIPNDSSKLPCSFLWNTGDTTDIILGIMPGIYSVRIIDNAGDTTIANYTLANPATLTANFVIINNSSWPVNNGRITITSGGGSGVITYQLYDSIMHTDTNQITPVFNNLASGTYYITSTDMNGCFRNDTVRVKELAAMTVVQTIDLTACFDGKDGRNGTAAASFEPSGPVPVHIQFKDTSFTIIKIIPGPRPYILSNNDTISAISYDAYPNFNWVKIWSSTSNDGYEYSWFVDSVVSPIRISFSQQDVNCFAGNNGSISVYPSGSYGDFEIEITGPNGFFAQSSSVNNIEAGVYTISVRDSTGCSLQQTVSISQPDEKMKIQLISKATTCFEKTDGWAEVKDVFGYGKAPFQYTWSNGANTARIDQMGPGMFFVQVRDAQGCLATDSVYIQQSHQECLGMPNAISPNGDGINDVFEIQNLCDYASFKVQVFRKTGELIYEMKTCTDYWDGTDNGKKADSGSTYFIKLVLDRGFAAGGFELNRFVGIMY
jgi:gliding motility-associated-like protein